MKKRSNFNNPKKNKRNGTRGNRGGRSGPFPPPKTGEPETKTDEKGKKFHYCSKCERWNLTHVTKDHRTKEELAKAAKVSMTKVDFDLHPVAYHVVGPTHLPSAKPSILGYIASTLMSTIMMLIPHYADIPVWITQYGVPLLVTVSSALISAYGMYMLYQSTPIPIPEHTVRTRHGPNYIKKIKRHTKRQCGPVHSRVRTPRSMRKHAREAGTRQRLQFHPCYHKIPRPNRTTPPTVERVALMHNDIDKFERHIEHLRTTLAELKTTYFEHTRSLEGGRTKDKHVRSDWRPNSIHDHFCSFPSLHRFYSNPPSWKYKNRIYVDYTTGHIGVVMKHSAKNKSVDWLKCDLNKIDPTVRGQGGVTYDRYDGRLRLHTPPKQEPYDIKMILAYLYINKDTIMNTRSTYNMMCTIEMEHTMGYIKAFQKIMKPVTDVPKWRKAMTKEFKSAMDMNTFGQISKNKHATTKWKVDWEWKAPHKIKHRTGHTPRPCKATTKKIKEQISRSQTANETKPYHVSPWAYAMTNCFNLDMINSRNRLPQIGNPVLFDSGANCCITHAKEDFIRDYEDLDDGPEVQGIGKGLKIKGVGTITWTFIAENGIYRKLKLPCYYVPECTTRIASVKRILEAYPREEVRITSTGLVLVGYGNEPAISVPFCPKSSLPIISTQTKIDDILPTVNNATENSLKNKPMKKLPKSVSVTEGVNHNLSEPEKELLRWHYRLGHIGIKRVQWLFRQGILAKSEKQRRLHESASKLSSGPLCTACQYAKQRRKTSPGYHKKTTPNKISAIKVDNLFPGQRISADHFDSKPRGRLLHTYGKEAQDDKYCGGCIFVDHASGLVDVRLQSGLNSHQTLQSKKDFEAMCGDHGVVVQEYLTDNGTAFTNKDFTAHLEQQHQINTLAGVGAHHHNGVAERNIGSLLSLARAMLHHAALHWPDVADATLWPLAVLHSAYIMNHIPREETGLSPIEIFSRKTWPKSKLHDLYVWGCPIYVLDDTISDGKRLPRWRPRSDRCVYMGHSPKHATSVPLVLNLTTGKITAQFHVIADNGFQTVPANDRELPNFEHDHWYRTFGLTADQYVQDEYGDDRDELPQHSHFHENNSKLEHLQRTQNTAVGQEPNATKQSLPPLTHPIDTPLPQREPQPQREPIKQQEHISQREHNPQREPSSHLELLHDPPTQPLPTPSRPSLPQETPLPPSPSSQRENLTKEDETARPTPPKPRSTPPRASRPITRSQTALRRSTRERKPRMFDDNWVAKLANYQEYDVWTTSTTPMVFAASRGHKDPTVFTWDEAMMSEHRDKFIAAAKKEIDELVEHGTWEEVPKSSVPEGHKIIPSQIIFKIKVNSDGIAYKWKGRCVLRGDLMNTTTSETYSPVAAWSTVRSFVVTTAMLNWVTTTIDFNNAFVQSPQPESEPVWMHIPRGFKSTHGPDYCLRMKKSIYGSTFASILWFKFIGKYFRELGLTQSDHDECLWYGNDIVLVLYVDDCGIGAPRQEIIDEFVRKLKEKGLELTQEGSFAEFLGIKFTTHKDGSIELTQKGLIEKILKTADMEDCNPNYLPAQMTAIGADKKGEPMNESWNYRAIIGMLLYLSTNTRVDIAFAVSQVARFSNEPKKSHATAVKTILRYLKGTKDKGMILKPSNKFNLDLYVDADFCGLYKREDDMDPNSARSRSGWVIMLGGCPLIWKSQLQSHITQSTTEAEYSALSTALKTFLPLKSLVQEMIHKMCSDRLANTTVHASVFEDNQSAYFLATNQRLTNRTKYFLAKWHWFWDCYKQKMFEIYKCPTDKMWADFLTKMLPKEQFELNRQAVQGWTKRDELTKRANMIYAHMCDLTWHEDLLIPTTRFKTTNPRNRQILDAQRKLTVDELVRNGQGQNDEFPFKHDEHAGRSRNSSNNIPLMEEYSPQKDTIFPWRNNIVFDPIFELPLNQLTALDTTMNINLPTHGTEETPTEARPNPDNQTMESTAKRTATSSGDANAIDPDKSTKSVDNVINEDKITNISVEVNEADDLSGDDSFEDENEDAQVSLPPHEEEESDTDMWEGNRMFKMRALTKEDRKHYDDIKYVPADIKAEVLEASVSQARRGPGLRFSNNQVKTDVRKMLKNANGDMCPINEHTNSYAITLLSRALHAYNNKDAPESTRQVMKKNGMIHIVSNTPEETLKVILHDEIAHCAHLNGVSDYRPVTNRVMDVMYGIMLGYTESDTIAWNPYIGEILMNYITIRNGYTAKPFTGNEVDALASAIKTYYEKYESIESGCHLWMFPIMVLCNEQLKAMNLTTVTFAVAKHADDALKAERKTHSKVAYRGTDPIMVEARQAVLDQYQDYQVMMSKIIANNIKEKETLDSSPDRKRAMRKRKPTYYD